MQEIKNKLKIYIDNNLIENKKNTTISFNIFKRFLCEDYSYLEEEPFSSHNSNKFSVDGSPNIKNYLEEHEQYSDFQTMLFKFIDSKNLKDSDVYNKIHMDRRLFSKIRSDKYYHPSKETIVLLAIALELNENELDELLESASYSLPKNNTYDLIIRFCFINRIFKLTDINELLYEYNCKLFNY